MTREPVRIFVHEATVASYVLQSNDDDGLLRTARLAGLLPVRIGETVHLSIGGDVGLHTLVAIDGDTMLWRCDHQETS